MLLALLLALLSVYSTSANAPGEAEAAQPAKADASSRTAEASTLAAWRDDLERRCIGAIRTLAGASPLVPADAQCACTLDRMTAGKTLSELQADERSGRQAQTFVAALRQCMMETPVQ